MTRQDYILIAEALRFEHQTAILMVQRGIAEGSASLAHGYHSAITKVSERIADLLVKAHSGAQCG